MTAGRPSKFSPEIVQKLEYAFSIGASIEEACFYSDIVKATYYEWIKDKPELSERFDQLRQRPVFIARETVVKGIGRDPKLALDFLGRKAKKEFGNNVDITTDGKALPAPILGGITASKDGDAIPSDTSNA